MRFVTRQLAFALYEISRATERTADRLLWLSRPPQER